MANAARKSRISIRISHPGSHQTTATNMYSRRKLYMLPVSLALHPFVLGNALGSKTRAKFFSMPQLRARRSMPNNIHNVFFSSSLLQLLRLRLFLRQRDAFSHRALPGSHDICRDGEDLCVSSITSLRVIPARSVFLVRRCRLLRKCVLFGTRRRCAARE